MKLKRLLESFDYSEIRNNRQDINILDIGVDSRLIKSNYIFVALKGSRSDGHNFINEALRNGAKAIVIDDRRYLDCCPQDITVIYVNDSHKALVDIASCLYGYPARKLKIIGVTGTNGKTTVTYLLEQILQSAGFKVGVIGTINYRFAGKEYKADNTTPDSLTLQRYFKQMLRDKVDYVIMEVSSHALDQKRVDGIDFCCAVFTNFTSDHLDYHKTREDYFKAKLKLFTGLPMGAYAVINNDDAYAKRIINATSALVTTFSFKKADVMAKNINLNKDGIKFSVITDKKTPILIKSRLIGRHNIYNILTAISCALRLGINAGDIKKGISNLLSVPGRLEPIETNNGYKVFVDFAHTEDGLRNALSSLKEVYKKSNFICIFGCGGDRDKTKRPRMGNIASMLSDYVIITSDNPRTEKTEDIAADITSGMKKHNYEILLDRKEAIKKGILLAKNTKNSVALIAGKGHEQYQIIDTQKMHFDDKEIVQKIIKSLK